MEKYDYQAIISILNVVLMVCAAMTLYGIWGTVKYFLFKRYSDGDCISLHGKLLLADKIIKQANSKIYEKMETVEAWQLETVSEMDKNLNLPKVTLVGDVYHE